MIAINIGLLAWVIAAAFAVGWFSCYLCRDRTNDKLVPESTDPVKEDPEYVEWYIQHTTYADGRSTYTVYKRLESPGYIPWYYGTFDSFEGAMVILNAAKAKHEALRVVSTRNFIIR